jgi:hypothetical protein
MASLKIQQIHSGSLDGGKSGTSTWKNPPVKNVVGFWVAPKELTGDEFLPGQVSFEITKVSSIMDGPNHFRVDVTVKNTGAIGWGYLLYMSYLG